MSSVVAEKEGEEVVARWSHPQLLGDSVPFLKGRLVWDFAQQVWRVLGLYPLGDDTIWLGIGGLLPRLGGTLDLAEEFRKVVAGLILPTEIPAIFRVSFEAWKRGG